VKINLDDLSGPKYVESKPVLLGNMHSLAGHDNMLLGNHAKLLN
jgi:hypothetical protein